MKIVWEGGKIVLVYGGGWGVGGYEWVNWGEKVVDEGWRVDEGEGLM